MSDIPTIKLERVVLRRLTLDDTDDIFEAYSDSEAMKFRQNPPLQTIEDAESMIIESHRLAATDISIRWGIEDKATKKIVGTFIWKIENGTPVSEIGYSLNKEWWNKGIMSEVVSHMAKYLFDHESVDTLVATVRRDNVRSVRLLEKMRFTRLDSPVDGRLVFRKENPNQ